MSRRRLVPGEACRHGHPWNRTPDGKRCLTCYPPGRAPLTVDELLDRHEQKAARDRERIHSPEYKARRAERRQAEQARQQERRRAQGHLPREEYLGHLRERHAASKAAKEMARAARAELSAAKQAVKGEARRLKQEASAARWEKTRAQEAANIKRREARAEATRQAAEKHRGKLASLALLREQREAKRRARADTPKRNQKPYQDNYYKDYINRVRSQLRKRGPGPYASRAELREMWANASGRCALTGVELQGLTPHLDHIVPIALGGTSDIGNLRFVHPKANQAKHEGTDEEFWSWIDAVIAEREKLF